ncbi:hypothetical protein [Altererythrobacter sp. ZODW24]|uniref:hypothetical protein n=1 Tax=Altererythrobacter sp. ZODW24 TaxID=2185142 RepID=UPI000DF78861|nr:hypothetical protein [Altererythrobacter sp. ZODW24]
MLIASAALALAVIPAQAEEASALDGEWTVDLRLSLDDEAYTQPLVLVVSDKGAVSGAFYGSLIEVGRFGKAQGRQCIAFRTSDGSGNYQHSACLVENKMIGQSWSEGRGFVLPWTATRK